MERNKIKTIYFYKRTKQIDKKINISLMPVYLF